ncbi:hypothetical protein MBLNU459_g2895t1 [Dothideomycetes sp. NU459]
MSTNPNQLFLLADHLKLSLLDRQRAIALKLEPARQDTHIARSLDTLREGIEALQANRAQQEELGEDASSLATQIARLQTQHADLAAQFHAPSDTPLSPSIAKPNDPTLRPDFAAASTTRPSRSPKNVRFRDNPSAPDAEDAANRASLFPPAYRDEPEPDASAAQANLDNQQIHAYHTQVLRDQDAQLDVLGESIGRQRVLGIQMGSELDEQNEMLEDVEAGVDRHQGTLDRARNRLGKVARKAKDNWSWVTIAILILILILLISLS